MESKFERVTEPDDPRRCQGISHGKYQCLYVSVEGTGYCVMHSAATSTKKQEAIKANYKFNRDIYRNRIMEFAENPERKSLREEVGVLRLLLETQLNKITDDTELLLYSSKLSELVLKIDKVVLSCHSLETKTGKVLDQTAIINLAEGVVQILSNYVVDPDILHKVSHDIGMLLQSSFVDPLK